MNFSGLDSFLICWKLTIRALTTTISSSSQFFQLPLIQPSSHLHFTGYTLIESKCQLISLRNTNDTLFQKISPTIRFRAWCTRSIEEMLTGDNDEVYREDTETKIRRSSDDEDKAEDGGSRRNVTYWSDSLNLGIREPVYGVVEVSSSGMVSTRKFSRRHLLKSSGLCPRDILCVDPSLWVTNTMPSLLVRENAKSFLVDTPSC